MPLYYEVIRAAHDTTQKILARRSVSARVYEVEVSATGGETASVRWSHARGRVALCLPSLPADASLSRTEADRIVGYIAHECCHVISTDWSVWTQAVRAGDRVRLWTNALEDVRIEQKEIKGKYFPALRGLLSTTMDGLHYKGVMMHRARGTTIGATIADAPYCAAVAGRLANGYDVPTAARLWADMHPATSKLVTSALQGLRTCKSTLDVLGLARRLVALEATMAQAQAQTPSPTPTPTPPTPDAPGEDEDGAGAPGQGEDGEDGAGAPGQGNDGEDGAPGQGEDGEDGAGAPGDGEDGAGAPGDGEDGAGAPGDGEDGSNAQEDAGGEGHGDPYSTADAMDPTDALADVAKQIAQREHVSERRLACCDQGLNGYKITIGLPPTPPPSTALSALNDRAARRLNAALPNGALLHGQISRMLVAPERLHVTHRETSGRLDRRSIARMQCGALDVFSRRHLTPGSDTALLILIDGSGSMSPGSGTDRMQAAVVAAWHIAVAAETAGAKIGVFLFQTPNDPGEVASADLTPVIPFGSRVLDCAWHLGRLNGDAMTPLSPAILGGAEILADMDATRRIQLVLTDGDCDYGPDNIKTACRIADYMGVETVALGMACPSVVSAFPDDRSVNVPDIDALGRVGMGVLANMLEEAGGEAD